MDKEKVLAILRQFKKEYAQDYHLLSLGVFGSVARDEAKPESDVDIVFETDQPNLFRTASMKVELENLLGHEVDLIRLREKMDERLHREIEKEAVFA
jgi:predicted nucleotidyltransferase